MIERRHVEAVLERIRPLLQADGADVELIDVDESAIVVHVSGLCSSCGGGALAMHTGLADVFRDEVPGFDELRLV